MLIFGNTSRVYSAERQLRAHGIAVGLRPVPPGVPSRCGICLEIDKDLLDEAVMVLSPDQEPDAVYMEAESGLDWLVVEREHG